MTASRPLQKRLDFLVLASVCRDMSTRDDIRRFFADLMAAYEDAAGVAACGQGAGISSEEARAVYYNLGKRLAELVRLQAQLGDMLNDCKE